MKMREQTTVLLADDDEEVAESLRLLLEAADYKVLATAPDGMEAVALTQSLQPDAIVMDVHMADMDGIEAARLIHSVCPTPVVILTAHDSPELLRDASDAGVGMYLVKPTSSEELDRAISITLARFEDMMELRRLNEELQERNEDLDAFAHSVAHDLKTPLQYIINYADLLVTDWRTLTTEDMREQLETIAQNGMRMANIINELLLLAETRQAEVKPSPVNMAAVVADAQGRLGFLIGEYGAIVNAATDWPAAMGYAPWLAEVWVNYLSNAVKYGGQPPEVEMGADAASEGMVRFWVKDNGEGISPEAQSGLFQPFSRLEQVSTEGHGLGLSIVRRIVEKLGGEVGVESEAGMGSTFSFTLPVAPGQAS